MAQVPKYIEALIDRRTRYADELMRLNGQISQYCDRIGIDKDSQAMDDAAIVSDFRIYTEPYAAGEMTKEAIRKQLEINEERRKSNGRG